MMNKSLNLLGWLLLILATAGTASCSKDVMLENDGNAQPNSTLVLHTRAGADGVSGTVTVSYPVTVYVFDKDDRCVAVSVMNDADDEIRMKLVAGLYSVCAVAGAGSDDYVLPTMAEARKNSIVSLKEGKSHSDLMYAGASVPVQAGAVNTLELVMSRKVMLLEEVKINGVPESVTGVSVTIVPLYENLSLDGTYSGVNGTQTITLAKEEGTDVWKNVESVYMLEASGNATVTVGFTDADGTKSYSYTLTDKLEANYKIKLEGTYLSDEGVLLSGTMTGAEWAGERIISFEFGEGADNGSGDDNPDIGGGTITADAPAAGTMYEGCYVLSNVKNGDGSVTVVLMTGNTRTKLDFDAEDQSSVASAVNAAISEMAVEGISGWRLPSLDEIKNVVANRNSINKVLGANGFSDIVSGQSYFYETANGSISSYCASDNADFNGATRLKAFATVTFKNN